MKTEKGKEMETYTEKVNRFVVEKVHDLPETHKAEYRKVGVDPDDHWVLKWSFEKREDAEKQLEREYQRQKEFNEEYGYNIQNKFRVRDLGETKYIERPAWF